MNIPDFQSVMLPVLKTLSLGDLLSTADVVQQVSDEFNLSEEQRAALLPSGKQTIIVSFPRSCVGMRKKVNSAGLQLANLVARPVGVRTLRTEQTNRAFDVCLVPCLVPTLLRGNVWVLVIRY